MATRNEMSGDDVGPDEKPVKPANGKSQRERVSSNCKTDANNEKNA